MVHGAVGETMERNPVFRRRQSIELVPTLVQRWPKLAWVASITEGSDKLRVFHGPCVEVQDDWCAEAVWCGDFAAGDFDRTDRVFGTGVRVRGTEVIFVTSGTTMDRLWHRQSDGRLCVSNSLSALCACTGVSLIEDRRYEMDVRTVWGSPSCTRMVPVDPGEIGVTWFNNLVYRGNQLEQRAKPDTAPAFHCYREYLEFLLSSAELLGENIRSSSRQFGVVPFVTVSSGYDSPAVALIARHAGCEQAVTIEDSNSFWRGSDSGAPIAERLGLCCRTYRRTARAYPKEVALWAASGRPALLSWSLFDYPEPVSAMFLGCCGDLVWSPNRMAYPYGFLFLGMGEFRLWVGTLQCMIAYWGRRHAGEIDAITFSDEMSPWRLRTDYDRPIPRRMLEEAGIPRGTFAVRKKDTSHESPFRWPYSPEARDSFRDYLSRRALFAPPDWLIWLIRRAAFAEKVLHKNILRKLGLRKRFRPWQRIARDSRLFHWASEELKGPYLEGLRDVQTETPAGKGAWQSPARRGSTDQIFSG